MKKISFVVGRDYQLNKIFDLSNSLLNRDNCLYPFFLLREEFKKNGFDLQTSDLLAPADADLVIYNEMPSPFPANIDSSKSYLLLFETELIRPDNWDFKKHKYFKKIFTWNDKIIDGKRYIKFNFPNEIKTTTPGLSGRSGFLTSISGNKTSHHPLELYSERLESIKWFSKNHPDKFTYFGIGWDYSFSLKMQKILKKLHLLSFIPKNSSPSYGGRVEQKLTVLRGFKFALCYENGKKISGYITEKIFDCLFAGVIPVYWGADNISSYVPKGCYVNREMFKNNEELYKHLIDMSESEILIMQKNIEEFLKSDKVIPFSNEFFVKNIIETVINE